MVVYIPPKLLNKTIIDKFSSYFCHHIMDLGSIGASNGMPAGKSLKDYMYNDDEYYSNINENVVVKDIIFSEI